MKISHAMLLSTMMAMMGLPLLALSQSQTPTAATPAPSALTATPTPAPYSPSMSDLMNIGVQPRHIKLWLAGKQQNWAYATYELDELRNAFTRVGRTIPVYRTLDIPTITTAFTKSSLDALDAAIKGHDSKAFNTAYRQLTDSCNACHQGAQHDMVVIKVPDTNAYADQEFGAKAH